jgi:hypothetical protein
LAEAIDPARTKRRETDGDGGRPEPSTGALGSGYELTAGLNGLNRRIDREYGTMFHATVDAGPNDLPVTKILTRAAAGPALTLPNSKERSSPRLRDPIRIGSWLVGARLGDDRHHVPQATPYRYPSFTSRRNRPRDQAPLNPAFAATRADGGDAWALRPIAPR